jgi:ribosome maturation factor RimP
MEVASAGVSSPLKKIRQYKKNIGRTLIVKTNTENIEAELVEANDDFVILSWKAREPKKIGKGKETVEKILQIPYTDIKEAIVTVTF